MQVTVSISITKVQLFLLVQSMIYVNFYLNDTLVKLMMLLNVRVYDGAIFQVNEAFISQCDTLKKLHEGKIQ